MGQEREESQGFYEMLWDCDHCDTRGLLGKSQRYCANCGAPQNPDKRYFPPEDQKVRVDGHLFEGADRRCPACSSPQSAKAHNCTHCGSELAVAAEVRGFVASDAPVAAATTQRPRRRWLWPFMLAAVVVLGGGIWWRCLRTETAQAVVAGHKWTRAIAIEEFTERQEAAWRNEMPVDAGYPTCRERERSSRQVEDGEECKMEKRDKKDGTFEQVKKCKPKYRSEPVMDSWCTFTARRWNHVTDIKSEGNGLQPAWPANVPTGDARATLGAKRQGRRSETLILDFGERGTCDVSESIWRKYSDGQNLAVEIRSSSGSVVCSSL